VNRHWGFLTFMEQQGVLFDVIGYHIYPWEHHQPLDQDPWFGPGGPLGQLALFKKPITINDLKCSGLTTSRVIATVSVLRRNESPPIILPDC
jgi:hypothetical protein